MLRHVTVLCAVACGNDRMLVGDAAAPGSPVVTILTPRMNESFYPSDGVAITWSVTSDRATNLACDVIAAPAITIATAVPVTTAATAMTVWALATVGPGSYRITITCVDTEGLTGRATSGAFHVSAPPQAVSYATQIQPIWNAACTDRACHDAMQPAGGLDLTVGVSYQELVNRPSDGCPSTLLVRPTMPTASYLIFKLQGSGPCLVGSIMPKGAMQLPTVQLQLVRDWIANGAPDN